MKKSIIIALAVLLTAASCDTRRQLQERAFELCRYIPDHRLLEQSRDYLTADFYALLDTLFNLPNHEALDHEWLYYFVTGNGGTIADYEVADIQKQDRSHAIATINVRQIWEDGSFDEETDIEEHQLFMEKVNGVWLMSDFDGHKEHCVNYIAINRQEQAIRKAISDYLTSEIGTLYLQGDICIPTLMMVYEEDDQVWGDFWVYWYNYAGDTLKCVSGGNHSGLMTLEKKDQGYSVTSFVQVADGAGFTPSAKRIFRDHYDLYCKMHSNQDVREAVRKEQLEEYVSRNDLPFRYYQDYGWPAVEF